MLNKNEEGGGFGGNVTILHYGHFCKPRCGSIKRRKSNVSIDLTQAFTAFAGHLRR